MPRRRLLTVVVALGLVAARLLLGVSGLGTVAVVAAVAIELVVLGYLAVRVRRIVRQARALMREGHSVPTALDHALRAHVPIRAVASLLAAEISIVVLAITGWFRSPPAGFAMHRRSGILLILGVLTMLAVVEAIVVHVVLVRVAPTLAIVLTALSAYSLLWLIGFAQSVRLSPLRFTGDAIVIERGITRRTVVPLHAIARALPTSAGRPDALDLSYVEPNVVLELSAPVDVCGMFGRTRNASNLLLSIDDRDAFLARLAEQLDRSVVDRAAQ